MKKKSEYPYPECEKCKDLGDCRHVDVEIGNMGMSLPMPPDNCPRPIDVMREGLKKRKHDI